MADSEAAVRMPRSSGVAHRRWRVLLAVCLFLVSGRLLAASYSFPGGPFPGGCTASGSTVTCAWWVTLNSGDIVTVTSPVTWVLNGAGGFNGAQVNVGGNPANLTIQTTGSLNLSGNNNQIVANISAANIYGNSSTNTKWTGNITLSGQLDPGNNAQLTGQINVGLFSGGPNNVINGNIQSLGEITVRAGSVVNGQINGGLVNINNNSTVNGNITSTGDVNLYTGAKVYGHIVAGWKVNASYSGVVIDGNITAVSDVNLGPGINVDGNVNSGGQIALQTNGYVNGSLYGDSVHMHIDSMIEGNIEAVSTVTSEGIIQGNVNSKGPVWLRGDGCTANENGRLVDGEGCANGYVNAPNHEDLPPGSVTGPTCDQNVNEGPCSGGGGGSNPSVLFYRLVYSSQPSTCSDFDVTVYACNDAGCNSQPQLVGGIGVQAIGADQTFTGNGAFASTSSASVSIAIPAAGSYTLALGTAPIAATEPLQCVGPTGCSVVASDAQLIIREVGHSSVLNQIAGVAFAVEVDANACGNNVSGNHTVNLSLECVDPGACMDNGNLMEAGGTPLHEWPASVGLPVSFSNGVGVINNLVYEDVGLVRLRASLSSGSTMSGNSNTFVVRPDFIDLEVANAYSPQVVGRAGDELDIVLTARSRSGQVTPSFGLESIPEALSLAAIGNAVVPANGVQGVVSVVDSFVRTGAGEFTSTDVRYSEAGIAEWTAQIDSMDYLGAGHVFTRHNVGRFVPWQFRLEGSAVTAACTASSQGFSYLDEPFYVTVTTSARNRDGFITLNYPDVGAGSGLKLVARDEQSGIALSNRILPLPIALTWAAGEGNGSSAAVAVTRRDDFVIDGPFDDVTLAALVERDPNGPVVPMYDADFRDDDEDCVADLSCNAVTMEDNMRFVYGRMVLMDTFGPETSDVPVSLQVHFWDGQRFRLHNSDYCTDVDPDKLSIVANVGELATTAAGYITVMANGQAPAGSLRWTAPNQTGQMTFSYEAPDWLKTGEEGDEDPEATAAFGSYGGHDRVISWKLVR